MSSLQEVPSAQIFETVMDAVRSAQRLICATMDVEEELKHPLPEEYFFLLNQRLDEGVKIHRVGFGSPEAIQTFLDRNLMSHPNYRFTANTTSAYQRMILLDGEVLFFAIGTGQDRHFYMTTDPKTISEYQAYFLRVGRCASK